MTRRQALAAPLAAAAYSASAQPDPQPSPQPSPRFTKGICSVIFPKEAPRSECFAQAKSAGFDAIELSIGPDFPLDISHDDARRLADAAGKVGVLRFGFRTLSIKTRSIPPTRPYAPAG